MNATQEQWRPIRGWNYQVSNLGRIRNAGTGAIRKNDQDRHGYPRILLCNGPEVRKRFLVHHLVAEAFIGPRPDGMEVRHANDVRDDNRADNLRYGTRSDNMYDSIRNGTHNRASRTHCCRGHEYTPISFKLRINKANGRTFRYCLICDRIRRSKE